MDYICITGTPIKGFQFHGPFPSDHAAVDWAEKELPTLDIDWHVSVLRKPSAALSAEDQEIIDLLGNDWDIRHITANSPELELDTHTRLVKYFESYWRNKEIHYKDGNPHNYDITNLEVVDKPEEISDVEQKTKEFVDFVDQWENERKPEGISADSESYAASMLPGISPEDINHLGEN